jgi:hypothetical protein
LYTKKYYKKIKKYFSFFFAAADLHICKKRRFSILPGGSAGLRAFGG